MFQEPQGSREAPSTAIRGSVELGERPAISGALSHAGEPSRTAVLTQMRRKAGVTAAKGKDTCVSGLGSVPGLHVRPAANHACRAAARAGLGPGWAWRDRTREAGANRTPSGNACSEPKHAADPELIRPRCLTPGFPE